MSGASVAATPAASATSRCGYTSGYSSPNASRNQSPTLHARQLEHGVVLKMRVVARGMALGVVKAAAFQTLPRRLDHQAPHRDDVAQLEQILRDAAFPVHGIHGLCEQLHALVGDG